MDPNPRIEALKLALRQALEECRAHNDEYHHSTPEHLLQDWERLLDEAGPASAATKPSPARRREPD